MNKNTIALFYRTFGKMLGTGIPLLISLETLKKDQKFKELTEFLDYLIRAVKLGKELHVAMAHAGFPLDQVEAVHKAVVAGELDYRSDDIASLAEAGSDFTISIPEQALEMEQEAIRLVNSWIEFAVKNNASDLHIIPTIRQIQIKFRIDGVLQQHAEIDKKYLPLLCVRIKTMADCDVVETRLPQDGRMLVRVNGDDCDIRICTVPSATGEKITLRFMPKKNVIIDLKSICLSREELSQVGALMEHSYGLLLVTGLTGSGKSTTCYSMLQEFVNRNLNVVTVEDPVEYAIEGATQIQVRPHIGLNFVSALRAVMRTDPDVIFVAEFRDTETINAALKAAQTGHLVIAVTHSPSACELLEMMTGLPDVEHEVLANVLIGVIAQSQLARKLCECKKKAAAPAKVQKKYGIKTVWNPVGCDKCLKSGYRGRIPVYEITEAGREIKEAIANKDVKLIRKIAASGMLSKAMAKVGTGETSLAEIGRILGVY
ncbi:MAG: ATPase, T2SS/T4P/T4SS family [Candidatus Wallbacteria bacterium]|nr:ATPase, T2SS/T4P/T4SS family [Candidatus Wallbacteria bacterium]